MNLWFSVHFLFAGLVLSTAAPTNDECQDLLKPLSLADPSVLFGKLHTIMGYTDNKIFDHILKRLDNNWMQMSELPGHANTVHIYESNKINGTCFTGNNTITIDGNTATMSSNNSVSEFHLLPSCDGCMVLYANSTMKSIDPFLQLMKLNMTVDNNSLTAKAVYLMAKDPASVPQDSGLEKFKKQASCLGFTAEPNYSYNPQKGSCGEGEGIYVLF